MRRAPVSPEPAAGLPTEHNPQHLIQNGQGASYMDSMGNPWTGAYVTASGNLMADFYYNATAEMQGRLPVVLVGLAGRWALRHRRPVSAPRASAVEAPASAA